MNYGNRIFGYYLGNNNHEQNQKIFDELLEYAFERDIYSDSIMDSDRPSLKCLLGLLKPGDTLYMHSLDNIMSNKESLKDLLGFFKKNNIKIRIVDLPSTLLESYDIFDYEKSISNVITDVIIDIVSKEVEKERIIAKRRQELGFAEAKKNGTKLGRRPKSLPPSFEEDYKEWKAGNCTAASLYKRYGMSNPCFYRHVRQYEKALTA